MNRPLRAVRLTPGTDLRATLEAWSRDDPDGGCAFVLSGVGSLGPAVLRWAGQAEATALPGDWELLSLAGSLSPAGAHLHASVADAEGRVRGGHVALGCRVRTTVELLLQPLPEGSLTRRRDPATGHDELVVPSITLPMDDRA